MLYIYVVSLKRDVDKRKVISQVLEDFGLEYSFIDAVYGKELSEDILEGYKANSRGKIIDRGFALTPGEIGCTLSHLMIYKDMLVKNRNWACVLEDDAILDERFETFIKNFDDSSLESNSLYLLGGQNGLDEKQIIKSNKNTITVGGQKFSKTIKSEQFIYRTCCYLISSYTAKKLIDISEIKFILADDWNYLVKGNIINKIYLSNFVDHPLDLTTSYLQEERESAYANRLQKKITFAKRVEISMKCRLRRFFLKLYTYAEKKERI